MKKNGFTLIELLVVVAIIGILAAVGVVAYSGYTSGAKNAVIKSNLKQVTIPKAWTHNGSVIPNDVGAVYAGVPMKNKYYPAYWVGKTYIESKGKTLYLKTYLVDETTLLSSTIEIPF